MKAISLVDFKQNAADIIRQIGGGKSFVLKYRGKPSARLEPIRTTRGRKRQNDSFYSLSKLAVKMGKSLSNEEMDKIVYGA